jgi:hypothetical protein
MKWVIIAIVAMIVPYTYLTLHFRKQGPAFQPYEDTRNRINNSRLLSAGYQRITLDARRPAEPAKLVAGMVSVSSEAAPGGMPANLGQALIDQPMLPVSIDKVSAGGFSVASQPYVIQFTCTLPDNKEQLADAHLYRLENDLLLVPSFEKLGGELLARTQDSTVVLTVPAGTLKPGNYTVMIVGQRASRRWTLQVH